MAKRGYIMKDHNYTALICKTFCRYYKEDKEDIHCGGYDFIRKNLTSKELKSFIRIMKRDNLSENIPLTNDIFELICRECSFLIDGCDYSSGLSVPPCGGYIIVRRLLFDK